MSEQNDGQTNPPENTSTTIAPTTTPESSTTQPPDVRSLMTQTVAQQNGLTVGRMLTHDDVDTIRRLCRLLCAYALASDTIGMSLGNFLGAHDVPKNMLSAALRECGISPYTKDHLLLRESLSHVGLTASDPDLIDRVTSLIS